MNAGRKIVVVGGGPAGVAAALAAKQQDVAADVALLSDESQEPYEKPPLSKAVLTGKAMPHDAPIAGPKGVAASGVRLTLDTSVKAIDRAARAVMTDAGERISYDALVLATGSINRMLPMFPEGQKGVFYLRTEAQARALKAGLHQGGSLLVIGGGLIGLEVAASAASISASAPSSPRCANCLMVGSASTPAAATPSRPISSWSAPASHPTIGWRRPRVSPRKTASWSTTMDAPAMPRSSQPATARAFPDRAGRCGWRTGGMPRSTARSRAAMPPVAMSSTRSCLRSGRSNTTCISKAWAGPFHNRVRAYAGRSARAPPSCSSSTAPTSRTRWASMRSATWRSCGG